MTTAMAFVLSAAKNIDDGNDDENETNGVWVYEVG